MAITSALTQAEPRHPGCFGQGQEWYECKDKDGNIVDENYYTFAVPVNGCPRKDTTLSYSCKSTAILYSDGTKKGDPKTADLCTNYSNEDMNCPKAHYCYAQRKGKIICPNARVCDIVDAKQAACGNAKIRWHSSN